VILIKPGIYTTNLQSHWVTAVKELDHACQQVEPQVGDKYKKLASPLLTFVASGKDPSPMNRIWMVTDAHQKLLLARFPPYKRLVGYDANFLGYLLWFLPDTIIDAVVTVIYALVAKLV